jgi:predicted RNA polymerase sigma factor
VRHGRDDVVPRTAEKRPIPSMQPIGDAGSILPVGHQDGHHWTHELVANATSDIERAGRRGTVGQVDLTAIYAHRN